MFKEFLKQEELNEGRKYGSVICDDRGIMFYSNRESQIPVGLRKKGNDGVIETYYLKIFSTDEWKEKQTEINKLNKEYDKEMKDLSKESSKKIQEILDIVEVQYKTIVDKYISKFDDLKNS